MSMKETPLTSSTLAQQELESKQQPGSSVSPWLVFLIFLRLGLTSFGGPVAHLGYFRDELIVRRRWMTERQYADLLALCHFLPGPSSSQMGLGLGISQAGYAGAFAAWLGFTMPSALILMLIAFGISANRDIIPSSVLHGLAIVAVAVITQAIWGMTRSLCPDRPRITIMVAVTCYLLLFPSTWGQSIAILVAAILGVFIFKPDANEQDTPLNTPIKHNHGVVWLSLFFILLFALPVLAKLFPSQALMLFDAFYRAPSVTLVV